jgi:hypothetical protein
MNNCLSDSYTLIASYSGLRTSAFWKVPPVETILGHYLKPILPANSRLDGQVQPGMSQRVGEREATTAEEDEPCAFGVTTLGSCKG